MRRNFTKGNLGPALLLWFWDPQGQQGRGGRGCRKIHERYQACTYMCAKRTGAVQEACKLVVKTDIGPGCMRDGHANMHDKTTMQKS
jgi:hypothetical protein